MMSPGCAEVRSADLLSWSCGWETTVTPMLLLATPLGTSALRACAVLLTVPSAAAVDCTCTLKLTDDWTPEPMVPTFQTTVPLCRLPFGELTNTVPTGTGSRIWTFVAVPPELVRVRL